MCPFGAENTRAHKNDATVLNLAHSLQSRRESCEERTKYISRRCQHEREDLRCRECYTRYSLYFLHMDGRETALEQSLVQRRSYSLPWGYSCLQPSDPAPTYVGVVPNSCRLVFSIRDINTATRS